MISPAFSIRRELAAGAKGVFGISLDEGKVLRFSIDKGDLALSVTLYGPADAKLFERVSQDFEVVEVGFPIETTGTYKIELQSREKTEKRQYELKVQSLTRVTSLDQKDSEAQQAMADAEVLRANWTETSLRRAITQYDKAALIWTAAGNFTNASRARLRSGDVNFLLSRYPDALKRYQDVLTQTANKRDWLAAAGALSKMARLYSYLGNNDLAQNHVTKALDLLKRNDPNSDAAARNAYGEALSNLGEIIYAKGNLKKASTYFEEASKFLDDDRKEQTRLHLFGGYIAGSTGDPDKAAAEISNALDLSQAVNNKQEEALALTALGLFHSLKRAENRAIELHVAARQIFRSIGSRHGEAIALNALGQAYENLSEYPIALDNYEGALRLFQGIGSMDGASLSTCNIARTHFLSGDSEQALTDYQRCLSLSRSAGKVRTEVYALNEIAKVYASLNRPEQTLKQYQRIQKFCDAIGDRRGQTKALNAEGDFLLQHGQQQRALDAYNRALPLSETIGDKGIRISTLYNLARANLKLGSPEAALPFIKQSLHIIEDVRANVASPEFRASYFSGVQKHYELCIEILMQLERLRPGQGFAAEALSVSEKGRARLLLDLVTESRANIREGATKELLDRERSLRGLLLSQGQYQMELSLSGKDATEKAEVAEQIGQLRSQYQAVQAQLREQNPRLSALEETPRLDVQRIQYELRDTDTMLLEYSLGDEHSYLWAVSANSFQSYELPPGKRIEDAARENYTLMTARQERQTGSDYQGSVEKADELLEKKETELSHMLLDPVARQLGNRRVIVVTEGALQYVSFEALPSLTTPSVAAGDQAATRLIETNEIVVLPSFSTLIAIRGERNHLPSSNKLVAVIADPVFSRSDERMQGALLSAPSVLASINDSDESVTRASEVLTREGLARLTHAAEEADAISAVAPWGTTMVAKGFDATRETAMSADIGQYQILHFATHGFLDSKHPELSGIVLTMVDRNGVKTNGLMPLHDIYGLELSAELTVLSACQTALGKDMKGEGLVGLTHSFMSAGSKSVIASLWKVDDEATALLMRDLYDSMLQKGMSPAAALRSAKLKMMHDKRWSAPYYWAGFVLQGEYTNHIAVDRNLVLRRVLVVLSVSILIAGWLLLFKKRKRRISPAQPT